MSPATHSAGSTRRSVRFSSASRSGPGRISTVPVGALTSLNTIDSVWRSLVGSPLTSMNCVPCVTGSNAMTKSSGSCTDNTARSPGGSSIESMVKSAKALVQRSRQIDARAPENLPVIFDLRQRIRIVAGDAPHPRADRECNLDHFVERRLVAAGAKSAGIFLVIDGFERRAGIEHATAAGTEHVPRQFEQTEPRGMKKSGQLRSSSRPLLAAKVSVLMRQSSRSGASRTARSIAATLSASADCRSTLNRASISLTDQNPAHTKPCPPQVSTGQCSGKAPRRGCDAARLTAN